MAVHLKVIGIAWSMDLSCCDVAYTDLMEMEMETEMEMEKVPVGGKDIVAAADIVVVVVVVVVGAVGAVGAVVAAKIVVNG